MSHMRVSTSVEKAFQSTFLKLKRRGKGVGVGVTTALIRMAIGRCLVCDIGSSRPTALLLSDAMLLLTKHDDEVTSLGAKPGDGDCRRKTKRSRGDE